MKCAAGRFAPASMSAACWRQRGAAGCGCASPWQHHAPAPPGSCAQHARQRAPVVSQAPAAAMRSPGGCSSRRQRSTAARATARRTWPGPRQRRRCRRQRQSCRTPHCCQQRTWPPRRQRLRTLRRTACLTAPAECCRPQLRRPAVWRLHRCWPRCIHLPWTLRRTACWTAPAECCRLQPRRPAVWRLHRCWPRCIQLPRWAAEQLMAMQQCCWRPCLRRCQLRCRLCQAPHCRCCWLARSHLLTAAARRRPPAHARHGSLPCTRPTSKNGAGRRGAARAAGAGAAR